MSRQSWKLGPGRWLVLLGKAVVTLVSLLLWLVLVTLTGLYQGTRTPWAGRQVSATGQVGFCRRDGPASPHGFGYWWACQVEVELADGRSFGTVVGNSTVTPADASHPVQLRAVCDGDSLACAVGRPSLLTWGVLLRIVRLVQWGFTVVLVGFAASNLLDAVVGPHRYFAIVDRVMKRK